jgi:hypothetical protein
MKNGSQEHSNATKKNYPIMLQSDISNGTESFFLLVYKKYATKRSIQEVKYKIKDKRNWHAC